jgi:nucleoside-diphosphate-sugar epimerase
MSTEAPTRWIAVTGATGFLGRHVAAAIRSQGLGMVAMGRTPVQQSASVRWQNFDLAAPDAEALKAIRHTEALIHLAWEGLPNYGVSRHVEVELPRHRSFIDAALDHGLRRLVVAGTCFEYGMQEGELREDLETHPTNPYGVAKDLLRKHAEVACERRDCALAWARLFYLYGDGQAPTSIWSQLVDHVRRGETVFPMSGGQQVRDFLPVSEAADTLLRLARRADVSGTFNVCSGISRTVEQTVRGWLAERGWSMTLDLGRFPYPNYEPFAFWGSRRRIDGALVGS